VFLPGGEGSDRPARAVAQPVAAARMPVFLFFALPLVAARMPGARRRGGGKNSQNYSA
jgi:hypothetical protein